MPERLDEEAKAEGDYKGFPLISFSRDKLFIEELRTALKQLNFSFSLSNKNLYIYKKSEIDRFFKEIKPSNMKHKFKYLQYKKYGEVPLTKELIKR